LLKDNSIPSQPSTHQLAKPITADGGRQPDKAMVNIAEARRQGYQDDQNVEKFHNNRVPGTGLLAWGIK
jgi:hypothetical protein